MTIIDLLVNRMEAARNWTLQLLSDTEESRWFEPPAPGVQHLAWQVGHLAASQCVLVHGRCFGVQAADHLPAGFVERFGRGSKPSGNRGDYPSIAEIRAVFDRIHAEALSKMRSIAPSELTAATHGPAHPMFENKGQCLAMASMHEAFHAGQIALTRRIFGKAPLR